MTSTYRYSEKRFNHLLLNMGIVRVGTLLDFRRAEHRKGIADPQEGQKKVNKDIDRLFVSGAEDPNARMLEAFRAIKLGPGSGVSLENVRLSKSFDHPDCFVFCSSAKRSRAVMEEFESADSCVEVFDAPLFYRELTRALKSHTPVVFRGLFPVTYQPREEAWNGRDWGHHPALIKEPIFSQQFEVRAVWTPRFGQAISPLVVGDYRLTAACREANV